MTDKALVTQSAGQTAIALARMNEHRALMEAYVKGQMVEGRDYGKVPGTDKNTLYKPGAEKLNRLFGMTPLLPIGKMIAVEDWTGEQHGGIPFFSYKYCCEIWENGKIVAESYGSCNSWESKYRWRWVGESDLPQGMDKASLPKRGGLISEFDFAVDKAETTGKYGKPMAYWQAFRDAIQASTAKPVKKKTRSGEEKPGWEIEATVYRIPNDDIFSQVNTIDKMAQKRSLVGTTLIAVNASEFFTQDIEDFEDVVIEGQYRVVEDAKSTATKQEPAKTTTTKPVAAVTEPAGSNGAAEPTEGKNPYKQNEPFTGGFNPSTRKWTDMMRELASECAHFANEQGGPNTQTIIAAAKELGWTGINDEWWPMLKGELVSHAQVTAGSMT